MAFAIVVLAVAIVALFTGGRVDNLKMIQFRHAWLVLVAVAVKIITNSGYRYELGISDALAPKLYVLGLALIAVFLLLNIRLRGLALVALGFISNFLAIVFNAGYMPVKREHFMSFATAEEMDKILQGLPVFNHIATGPDTKLYYLTDIFLMPSGIMITRVFSVGDVLLTLGSCIFVWAALKSGSSVRGVPYLR